MVGRNKSIIFYFLKEKAWREDKWLEEKISFYGKERDIDQLSSIVNSKLHDESVSNP